jgi:RimJ/RimL family protein N-acetyltransferase
MVPTLTTERLTMRGWRSDDLEPYAEIAADTEVMRFVGGALEPPEVWRQLAMLAGHWVLRGYGLWAVEHEGELVGRIGLWRPEGWPGLELGWLLARPAWGQGYATEAARAAMEWAWSELDDDQLISIIAHENVASLRVAQRLGMRPLREASLSGNRVTIHGIDR